MIVCTICVPAVAAWHPTKPVPAEIHPASARVTDRASSSARQAILTRVVARY